MRRAVPLGAIAAALSDGAAGGETAAALAGYAASGDSVRGAIEALARAMPLSLRDDGARLLLADARAGGGRAAGRRAGRGGGRQAGGAARDRPAGGGDAARRGERHLLRAGARLSGRAAARAARRAGAAGRERSSCRRRWTAGAAKAVAERRLADGWAERTTAAATLPWRRLDLRPGDAVRLPATAGAGGSPAGRSSVWCWR